MYSQGLPMLLLVASEVPGITMTLVCALQVSHEHLFEIQPVLNLVSGEMLEPRSSRVSQEQWQVTDNEIIIVRAAGSASEPVVLELEARVRLPGIHRNVGQRLVSL